MRGCLSMRGADGVWRHTSPDFTFWGQRQRDETSRVVVHYRDADATFARQLIGDVTKWLEAQCAKLGCDNDAQLHIEIVPEVEEALTWTEAGAGRLRIRSPYLELVRAEKPFDSERAEPLYKLIRENWDFRQ